MIAVNDRLDFELPPDLEAHEPPEARGLTRDGVRLLVTEAGGHRVSHARFADLPRFLRAGDLLVANDSATLPAALDAQRADGSRIPFHLSTQLPGGLWLVEPRAAHVVAGETLRLPGGGTASLVAPGAGSGRLWLARLDLPASPLSYLHQWGRPIAYSYVRGEWPLSMYQTIFADKPGSAEMPSAGRAFTPDVLERLTRRGVELVTLTLHTGVASLEKDEPPYDEPFDVPAETAAAIARVRAAGGRVVAVGTTVVRALETVVDGQARVVAGRGWTDLVVSPERAVRSVDGLLTGLHEPKASHLAMLEALVGRAHLERAYRAALAERYLWHEFGDLHLILTR